MSKKTLSVAAIFALANGIYPSIPESAERLLSRSGSLSKLLSLIEESHTAYADPCAKCHSKSEGNGGVTGGKGPISGSVTGGGSYSKETFCNEAICKLAVEKGQTTK
ncbi:hypothetical protein [Oligoflexus tunisiensis]|uniref:hypothetical protein n=1 Tax=Oligoflexus tunisiensis TaxID=708132 RepID=UPI00114C8753|nr:hypothetical protein [Oligoflexus tunisiensis]